MTIGTAKPTMEELSTVQHYFINHRSIRDAYSAGDFEKEAKALTDQLFKKNDVVIVAGGTGLYLKALTQGLDHFPDVPDDIRISYNLKLESQGISSLQNELTTVDPKYAQKVDLNNPHRLIRALSITKHTGLPYSSFLKKTKNIKSYKDILISLELPRDQIYNKINARVDKMIKDGLVDEVKNLYKFKHLPALNTVGYKEIFKHLDGEWSLELAIEKIKQHTRNYAKRQMTWFRNQEHFHQIDVRDSPSILSYINSRIDFTSNF